MNASPIIVAVALALAVAGAQAEPNQPSTSDEFRSAFQRPDGSRSVPRTAQDAIAHPPTSSDEARRLTGQRRSVAMPPVAARAEAGDVPVVIGSTDDARRVAHAATVCL